MLVYQYVKVQITSHGTLVCIYLACFLSLHHNGLLILINGLVSQQTMFISKGIINIYFEVSRNWSLTMFYLI